MKNFRFVYLSVVLFATALSSVTAQEEGEKPSPFSVGADFYSNYIWRGSKFGTGPAFQPSVKLNVSGLTIGVWGSFDASGYTESDPYISYTLPFGLTLGITDYYYPTHIDTAGLLVGSDFLDFDKTSAFHALEINGAYTFKDLSLNANYILNEAGGALSYGGDMYFEIGYSLKYFKIFAGAGNGWHTSDGKFALCNTGINTTKTISITESFFVPVSGSLIFNPDKKQLFVVAGFSL